MPHHLPQTPAAIAPDMTTLSDLLDDLGEEVDHSNYPSAAQQVFMAVVQDEAAFLTNGGFPLDMTTKNISKKKEQHKKPSCKNHDDPKTRVSFDCATFPGSDQSDWDWMDPIGWVHSSERDNFFNRYRHSSISKKFYHAHLSVALYDGSYATAKEVKAKEYLQCQFTSEYFPKDIAIKAKVYEDGKTLEVLTYPNNHSFGTCDFSKDLYPTGNLQVVRKSEKYKCVSTQYVGQGEDKPFHVCSNCCNSFYQDYASIRTDVNDAMLCNDCYNKHIIKNTIHTYNHSGFPKKKLSPTFRLGAEFNESNPTRPRFISTGTRVPVKDLRTYGVEVEVEFSAGWMKKKALVRLNMAKSILDDLGRDFILIKEDGSLTTNGKYSDGDIGAKYAGFEIVSGPCDIDYHRTMWPRLEKCSVYPGLRAWDTETCGFHVHVDRRGLTALQIARIVLFVNHKHNKLFIQKVAGRGSEKYCRYFDKEPRDAIGVHSKSDDTRRQAVNLTNEHTVEFRIFRGTVNPKHIVRNIEFCDAIVAFCHPSSRSLKDVFSYEAFVSFVENNRKTWPLFYDWLLLHKFIGSRPISLKNPSNKDGKEVLDVPESEIRVLEAT